MWYLFTVRIKLGIEQIVIHGETYDKAFEYLKNKSSLKQYKELWGQQVWIISCHESSSEIRGI